jgi:hypothetical protein
MPLLDHFHPPLDTFHPWQGFHSTWAVTLARHLNEGLLPRYYYAVPNVELGGQVEIDVATLKRTGEAERANGDVATAVWAPPRPSLATSVNFRRLQLVEVQIHNREGGPHLRAAIELVSPANKDRPSERRAFAIKCASYPQQGVALIVVDVVTTRRENLHAPLLALLELSVPAKQGAPRLNAAAYRPVLSKRRSRLEAWTKTLRLGAPLPTMPLWVAPDLVVPLNLEQTYVTACESLRMNE